MNPGNGIETKARLLEQGLKEAFKLMNPGNGIETLIATVSKGVGVTFKLMNPGNGIETVEFYPWPGKSLGFQTNESWQRDWNFDIDILQ